VTVVNIVVQPLGSGGGWLRSGYEVLSLFPGEVLLLFLGRRSVPPLSAHLGTHRNVHNVHTRPKTCNPKDFGVNIADEATITEGHTILQTVTAGTVTAGPERGGRRLERCRKPNHKWSGSRSLRS
jgi:hypothetical protein